MKKIFFIFILLVVVSTLAFASFIRIKINAGLSPAATFVGAGLEVGSLDLSANANFLWPNAPLLYKPIVKKAMSLNLENANDKAFYDTIGEMGKYMYIFDAAARINIINLPKNQLGIGARFSYSRFSLNKFISSFGNKLNLNDASDIINSFLDQLGIAGHDQPIRLLALGADVGYEHRFTQHSSIILEYSLPLYGRVKFSSDDNNFDKSAKNIDIKALALSGLALAKVGYSFTF